MVNSNMPDSIFTKIIKKKIPAEIVWENRDFIAILDIRPLAKGHTLLIPKVQIDKFYDLDEQTYAELFRLVKSFARKIEDTMQCARTGIIIEGFGVPHVHIHLIPMNHGGIIDTKHNYEASKAELQEMGDLMRRSFKEIS